MKGKMFLALLKKIVESKSFSVDGKMVKTLELNGNTLKVEIEGKEVDLIVESIKACKKTSGSFYELSTKSLEKKEKKKSTKKKETKEVEPTLEIKE